MGGNRLGGDDLMVAEPFAGGYIPPWVVPMSLRDPVREMVPAGRCWLGRAVQ